MMDSILPEKLPLGRWIAVGIERFNELAGVVLQPASDFLERVIVGFSSLLTASPPAVLILLACVVAFAAHRSWRLVLLVAVSLLLTLALPYWDEAMETLALVLSATAVCVCVGIPLGILAAHHSRLEAVLRPVLDLMQTVPTFVYLIPTLMLFGLGVVPGLISTVIFAMPAPIRLTRVGISSVPSSLIEAGTAFGATRRQLLWKIELPHALPTIMAGVTQCIMLSLSMVVIAALVGAGGLGSPVVRALNTVDIARGFEAGLSIVLLAIVLDRICRGQGGRTE